jgi:hypothetical protein
MEDISVILKITVVSKQAPIGRKFAQSGHPVPDLKKRNTVSPFFLNLPHRLAYDFFG